MPRREAFLRLGKVLLARRADQHRKLAAELASLRDFPSAHAIGDSADGAFENSSDEVSSQLAQLDAHELRQIERALTRLKLGTYGICEGDSPNCQKTIPLARLNALPVSTLCIHCQRARDGLLDGNGRRGAGSWRQVVDTQDSIQDRQISLSGLASSLSGGWKR